MDISQEYLLIGVPGFQGAEPSGKFRNSPKAGSGAEWPATLRNLPVISPPLSQPLLISFLLHAIPNFDRDDSGFVVQKQADYAPLRCGVSDNYVPYPALLSFSPMLMQRFPAANAFLS